MILAYQHAPEVIQPETLECSFANTALLNQSYFTTNTPNMIRSMRSFQTENPPIAAGDFEQIRK
jgi:hypothetical protein